MALHPEGFACEVPIISSPGGEVKGWGLYWRMGLGEGVSHPGSRLEGAGIIHTGHGEG